MYILFIICHIKKEPLSFSQYFVPFITHRHRIQCLCLQLLVNQLEPLTEQQLVGIGNLQQSSQQAEDALSQGMEALQLSLAETLSTGSSGSSGSTGNVANYMGQMAMAMGKLGTLEGFIRQVMLLFCFVFSFFLSLSCFFAHCLKLIRECIEPAIMI